MRRWAKVDSEQIQMQVENASVVNDVSKNRGEKSRKTTNIRTRWQK